MRHLPKPRFKFITPLLVLGLAAPLGWVDSARAACIQSGNVIICDSSTPNPDPNGIQLGPNADNYEISVQSNNGISSGRLSAISVGSNNEIDIHGYAKNFATNEDGLYGKRANTIEGNSLNVININGGGEVLAEGTDNNATAIKIMGYANRIVNNGTIWADNNAAVWFQDTSQGNGSYVQRNIVTNNGTIGRNDTSKAVIGTSGGNGIILENNGTIQGGISLAGGNDSLIFNAGSTVIGNINAGGGSNDLTLSGTSGSSDEYEGDIANLTTITKDGEGQWTLSGAISGHTAVNVEQGTLTLTGNNTNYTGDIYINYVATRDPNNAIISYTSGMHADATLEAKARSLPTASSIHNNGILSFIDKTTDDDDGIGTYTGQIEGTGQVQMNGDGVVTLAPSSGGNTYTGGTFINNGTIAIGSDSALGDASGGLTFGTATTGGTLRTDADMTLNRTMTLNAGGGTIDTNGNSVQINQSISGAGALTKTGDGILTLNAANSYGGGTYIKEGVLVIDNENKLGASVGLNDYLTLGGNDGTKGTLRITDDVSLSDALGNISLNLGGGTIDTFNASEMTISAKITGNSTLTKTGEGTLYLSNTDNTYRYGTNITQGTVVIAGAGSLGASMNNNSLSFGSDATRGTLQLDADVDLGNRAVTLNQGGGTFDTNGNNGALSGVIIGEGPLTKDGAGTLTLTGNNTYSGATYITAGKLQIGDGGTGGSIGTGPVDIANGATLSFNRADAVAYGGTISGGTTAVIEQKGPGLLLLTGAGDTFSGDIYVGSGILGLTNNMHASNVYIGKYQDGTIGDGSLLLTGGAHLAVDNTLVIAPDAGSSGALIIGNAAGQAPTREGTLSMSGGAVQFGSGSGSIVFNHTGDYYIFDQDVPGGISGTGTIAVYNGRTLLTQNSSAYSGPVDIYGGALEGVGTVGATTSLGSIAPGLTRGNTIGTLIISGNYTGDTNAADPSAYVYIDTVLGGDSSPTDLLHITHNVSGYSWVRVNNLNGTGAQTVNGIKIIQVDGAISPGDAFKLKGDYTLLDGRSAVIGGITSYTLHQGTPAVNDGDWYLRSTGELQPAVGLYEAMPTVLAAFNNMQSMRQRTLNRNWSSFGPSGFAGEPADFSTQSGGTRFHDGKSGLWSRVDGSFATLEADSTSKMTSRYKTKYLSYTLGADIVLYRGAADNSALVLGLSTHYTTLKSDIYGIYGKDRVDSDGYGLGGSLTWYADSGFFVDGQARITWFESDVKSAVLGTLAKDNDGVAYAFGLEAGKIMTFGNFELIPQGQLIYANIDYDSIKDSYGVKTSLKDGDSLQGRLGLEAGHTHKWRSDMGDAVLKFTAPPICITNLSMNTK